MVEIKVVDKENIPAVATLLRSYWRDRKMIYTQKWAEDYITVGHKVELKREQTFVLLDKNKVLGTIAVLLWEGNVAELRDFVVKKEQRNKGLGKKLLEFALDWCKRNNVRKVFALVSQDLRSFFESYQFILEGFLKNHFKEGEHLLLVSFFPEKKQDTQVDLKAKFDRLSEVQTIERETSARLSGLRT
tara:strand:+ start:3648 stop:4211 length:564 start_codon:yes stop_codon:yes gene_type:complete